MGRLRRRLAAAGYTHPAAAVVYSLAEVGLPHCVCRARRWSYSLTLRLLVGLLAAAVGFYLPGLVVEHKIRGRQTQITNGLPDALDILIVCIEAGNAIDQAVLKAAEELLVSHPVLAARASADQHRDTRGQAPTRGVQKLRRAHPVDDVRSLVAMLVQTDRFGTSVAQALKTYADVLRTKRRQRAEEKAAKLGVKLVFPLVFFLFPALYVVTLGPAVVQYIREFRPLIHHR